MRKIGGNQSFKWVCECHQKSLSCIADATRFLHYLWDPIGVRDEPGARDEYEDYLPHVFTLVRDGADKQKVADSLLLVEVQNMGLTGNAKRVREIAVVLFHWREQIEVFGTE